jgi:hypothetical protein
LRPLFPSTSIPPSKDFDLSLVEELLFIPWRQWF